jgi:hypothetical protein
MNTSLIISFIQRAILFYLAFNACVIGLILYARAASNAARAWPSVPGKIQSSRIHYQSSRSKSSPSPWVEYVYEVNGVTHKSMTISPGLAVSDQSFAEAMVSRYPSGAEVTVNYNPRNPQNACLEKAPLALGQLWGVLIMGNLFMPFLVLLTMFFFK